VPLLLAAAATRERELTPVCVSWPREHLMVPYTLFCSDSAQCQMAHPVVRMHNRSTYINTENKALACTKNHAHRVPSSKVRTEGWSLSQLPLPGSLSVIVEDL
jgi:hypothetical protein